MSGESQELGLQIDGGPGADAEEVDALTNQLRRQLLELDVESVEHISQGEAPPGARALDILLLGGLLVKHSPEVLKTVIVTVQSWVGLHPGRSVELQMDGDTLKLTGVSSDQQQQLIALFVARHSGAG